jgi:hypothetical protein
VASLNSRSRYRRGVILVRAGIELLNLAGGGGKIDRVEITPECIWRQRRLEEVELALVVDYGRQRVEEMFGWSGVVRP